jgi:hypothetical protein
MRPPIPEVDMYESSWTVWADRSEGDSSMVGTGMNCCPQGSVKPDYDEIRKRMLDGPVQAAVDTKPKVNITQNHYVFMTGMAYTGTTGLLGLLSTSPEVSNLCSTHGIACEGSWLLQNEQIASLDNPQRDPTCASDTGIRWTSPDLCWQVRNWTKGLESFHKYWDAGKKVLVDKSPQYKFDFSNMYDQLHEAVELSFIYLLSSPCYSTKGEWNNTLFLLRDEIAALRAKGAHIKIVRAEDLLGDPYGVAKDLLDFIPELDSLDPTQTGVQDAPYLEDGASRTRSLIQFVLDEENTTHSFREINVSTEEAAAFAELGYTKEWFASRPWFAT